VSTKSKETITTATAASSVLSRIPKRNSHVERDTTDDIVSVPFIRILRYCAPLCLFFSKLIPISYGCALSAPFMHCSTLKAGASPWRIKWDIRIEKGKRSNRAIKIILILSFLNAVYVCVRLHSIPQIGFLQEM
jgi:hypothetical protein